jgi:hypothetical protein
MKWFRRNKPKKKPDYQQSSKEIETTNIRSLGPPVELSVADEVIEPSVLKVVEEAVTVDFVCPHCDKSFNTKRGLNIHISRSH